MTCYSNVRRFNRIVLIYVRTEGMHIYFAIRWHLVDVHSASCYLYNGYFFWWCAFVEMLRRLPRAIRHHAGTYAEGRGMMGVSELRTPLSAASNTPSSPSPP